MKNLLLALFILVSGAAFGQTTVTENPRLIAPASTSVITVTFKQSSPKVVHVKFPEANTGTVKLNTASTTLTNSPVYSYTTHPNGILIAVEKFLYFQLTQSADKIEVSW